MHSRTTIFQSPTAGNAACNGAGVGSSPSARPYRSRQRRILGRASAPQAHTDRCSRSAAAGQTTVALARLPAPLRTHRPPAFVGCSTHRASRMWRRMARSILADATPSSTTPLAARRVHADIRRSALSARTRARRCSRSGLTNPDCRRGRARQDHASGSGHQRAPRAPTRGARPRRRPGGAARRSGRPSLASDSPSDRPCSIRPRSRATRRTDGNPWSAPACVTSLDYVKRPEVVRALEALIWDVLVFDEAHALAGRSDRATVASLLAQRARTLLLLTATPHSGDDQAFSPAALARRLLQSAFPARLPPDAARRRPASSRRTTSLRVRPTRTSLRCTRCSWPMRDWSGTGGRRPSRASRDDRPDAASLQQRVVAGAIGGDASATAERRRTAGSSPDGTPFRRADDDDEPAAELSCARTREIATKNAAGSSTSFDWHARPSIASRSSRHLVVCSDEHASRRSCSPSTATRCIGLPDHLRDLSPVLLHGGLTPASGGRAAAIRHRRRTPAARNRRSQRRTEPSSPLPAGDQPRAAMDAGPPGAAHRPRRAARTDEAGSRRPPARGRHVRRGVGRGAAGADASRRRRARRHAPRPAGAADCRCGAWR